MRHLVDERLEGEGERVAAGVAQRTGRNLQWNQRLGEQQARNEAGREMLARNPGRGGDPVPLAEGHEMVAESREPALRRQTRLEVMESRRPIGIVLDVLAPVPE